MDILNIFNGKIKEIVFQEEALCLLLIGEGAEIERKDFNQLNDIDLFAIIEDINDFEREVYELKGVKFDISYISLELLKKGVSERWPFIINSLHNYKYIYNESEEIDNLLNKIRLIYNSGPRPMKMNEIDYIRFKLYQEYDDMLARKEDKLNLIFLMNNLFKNILVSYFQLHNLWVPKDKKILAKLQKIDYNLYCLCQRFIGEREVGQKLDMLLEIMSYVLRPFGGVMKYWRRGKFPLK
jgi:hypothetical protein